MIKKILAGIIVLGLLISFMGKYFFILLGLVVLFFLIRLVINLILDYKEGKL